MAKIGVAYFFVGIILTVISISGTVSYLITVFSENHVKVLFLGFYLLILISGFLLDDWYVEIFNTNYKTFLGWFIIGSVFSLIGIIIQWLV
jgi:pheromone shutdown protein TraB